MANICSTYIQIFPIERLEMGRKNFLCRDVISDLLSLNFGSSYNTPIYMNLSSNGMYLEIVLGDRSYPSSAHEYFEKYKTEIEAIYYRYHSDVYDYINCLSTDQDLARSKTKDRLCKYGFDKIKLQSNRSISNPLIRRLNESFYEVNINGNYLSESSYSNLLRKFDFNDYKIDDDSYAIWGLDKQRSSNHDNLLVEIEAMAYIIEYYYKEKLVTYSIRKQEYLSRGFEIGDYELKMNDKFQWLHFPFDSWYNCVDEDYLQYLEKRNKAPNKS